MNPQNVINETLKYVSNLEMKKTVNCITHVVQQKLLEVEKRSITHTLDILVGILLVY